jgi:amino acid transporter
MRERDLRHETLDRELTELLAETRVVLPGVTVVFAFLLTVPFQLGFAQTTALQRGVYFVAFLLCALAMIFLNAISAYHRLRGKPYDKARMLRTASRQSIAAISLFAGAMGAVVFLVTDYLYAGRVAVPVTACVVSVAAIVWFFIPLLRRARQDR